MAQRSPAHSASVVQFWPLLLPQSIAGAVEQTRLAQSALMEHMQPLSGPHLPSDEQWPSAHSMSFEHGMHGWLKDKHAALLAKLEADKAMDKAAEAELGEAIEKFKKSFA